MIENNHESFHGEPTPASDEWTPVKHHTHKDTKKWCKGKEGREHEPAVEGQQSSSWVCRPRVEWWTTTKWMYKHYKDRPWFCTHRVVCQKCRKVLEHSIPWQECPDLPEAYKPKTDET